MADIIAAGKMQPILAFDNTGSGEPLVLMHGLATTRLIWRRVLALLEPGRRVIALDVPGFGDSPPDGPGFSVDAVAARIADGLAAAGVVGPYDLVGHSLGGALALSLAAQRPGVVRRLVLVSPAGLRPALPRATARALGRTGSSLIALRRAGAPLADFAWGRRLLLTGGAVDGARMPPAETRAMIAASRGASRIGAALTAAAVTDLRTLAAALPVPLGVLRGARDRVVSAAVVERLAADRHGMPAVTIADAGHIPMMERPEAFADALSAMLTRLDG